MVAPGTLVALVPLVLVLFYLLSKGLGALSWDFFTTDPTGRFFGDPGGIKSAIVGTILIVALATVIAVPIGIGVALYLVEYGKDGRFANVVRYFVDVMTGVPSIVFGLFIYIVLVLTAISAAVRRLEGLDRAGAADAPGRHARRPRSSSRSCPTRLREAALALGAPRWRVVFRVVLPTALPGLVTGSLLAIARAAGETAPLLFTAFAVKATTFNLGEQMNSLPVQIFNDVRQAQDRLVERAWGAALTLVLMILILTLLARLIQRRSRTA